MALGGRESWVISLILRTASLSIRQAKNKSYWHSPHQSLWWILGMGSRSEFCCVNARQTHWGKDWSHISVIYSQDHFVLVIFLHLLRLKGEGTAQRSIEPNKLTACNEVRGEKRGRWRRRMKNDRSECARENKTSIPERVNNKVWGKAKLFGD